MNYNDLQRMKPYYSTMNYRYSNNNYSSSVPKALPLIRNGYFDHSNVTVAPPIPSYYKQNINNTNYYSRLPNIGNMGITYSPAEKIAKKFSDNLNSLRNLEDKINENSRVYNFPRLQRKEIDDNLKQEMKEKLENKIENANDEEDIKNKINQMREITGRLDDFKTEEQRRIMKNKEIMSETGMNKFNVNLVSTLSDYTSNIQKSILNKNDKDSAMYDMIKKGIDNLKEDFSVRIEKFNKKSKKNMEIMRKLMQNSANPRLQLLSDHMFATSDIDQILKLREKRKNKNAGGVVDTRRMSLMMQEAADKARMENDKAKQEELLNSINNQENNINEINNNNIINKGGEDSVDKVELDLWERNRRNGHIINQAIKDKIASYGQNYFHLQPINKFRSVVFIVMSARRLLNVKYLLYKEFKFDTVSYYINNFEDMDIILKKLVYNTIKEPFLEILNNLDLELNLTYDNEDNHAVYYTLQEYIQRIMKLFNTKFFYGVAPEMLNYLSLYVTNYCFIPKDFFTTFELVRFRTTETGEFIELDDNNRKMILIFYIFIKILLRNIFLELMFNKADRKKVALKSKLNIKMIVSVFYRTIISNLSKNCVTKTNLEEEEEAEDMTAFLKMRFEKREFHLHRFLKKRYYLKVSEVEDKPKRVSKREKKPISPRSSENENNDEDDDNRTERETNKTKNKKKNKKKKEIEKEKKKTKKEKEEKDENEKEEKNNKKEDKKDDGTSENGSDDFSDSDESESKKKKTKGRGPPPKNDDDSDEEDEKTKKSKTNNKKKSSKSQSETSSQHSKTSKSQSKPIKINNKKSSSIKEEDNDDDEDEIVRKDQDYEEEKKKLMPKRKVSTEKVNGKLKKKLIGEDQKLKIAIRGKDPLKGKNTIKDFSKSDIDNMYFIIENFQSYGDDLDSNEVELLDKVLYTNQNLETYYLFAKEYNFDPGELVSQFMDRLLEKIQINFSKKYED